MPFDYTKMTNEEKELYDILKEYDLVIGRVWHNEDLIAKAIDLIDYLKDKAKD